MATAIARLTDASMFIDVVICFCLAVVWEDDDDETSAAADFVLAFVLISSTERGLLSVELHCICCCRYLARTDAEDGVENAATCKETESLLPLAIKAIPAAKRMALLVEIVFVRLAAMLFLESCCAVLRCADYNSSSREVRQPACLFRCVQLNLDNNVNK